MSLSVRSLRRSLSAYGARSRGAAALEFAIVVGLMTLPALNIVDLAVYAFDEMQTHNAAEMAAEAAFNDCNTNSYLPAMSKCTATSSQFKISFSQAVTNGLKETTLGNSVSLNSDSEGYYCATTTNTLVAVTNTTQTCSGYADTNAPPGDYVLVTAQYTYTPIFQGMTVSSLLPSTIIKTVWIRMG
jgi:Flp pilus assembly protein TadG